MYKTGDDMYSPKQLVGVLLFILLSIYVNQTNVLASPLSRDSNYQTMSPEKSKSINMTGTLVVVNKSDNSISLIDVHSATIINTLPTGKGPHELIVSEDGKTAVSTDFVGGDSLTVFDLVSQSVTRTIDLDNQKGPHGIAFVQADTNVAAVMFTSGQSQSVGFANIATGEISATIKTQQETTHMLALDAASKKAYTTNIRSNTISVLDIEKHLKIKDIPTAEMPEAINLSKDGGLLWYGANKQGLIRVIDTENFTTVAQFEGFGFPYRVLFNHDESVALVPDFKNHSVRFFDVKTLTEIGTLTLPNEAGPQGIVMHPDMNVAFLSLNLLDKVVAIDIAKREIIAEYPTGNNPDGVGFSQLVLTETGEQ